MDLNCDLGEGEPPVRTAALMRHISSANVACGGHAGTVKSMLHCIRLAKKHKVHLGAHPGPWDRVNFGRNDVQIEPDELELLLIQQVGILRALAQGEGVELHHVKLHGGLYHAVESHRNLAKEYVLVVQKYWPGTIIYAKAGGLVANIRGDIWEEAYADRAYQADGHLVRRNRPEALLSRASLVKQRVQRLLQRDEIETVEQRILKVSAKTICVHSDTPNAAELARIAATEIKRASRDQVAGINR